MTDAIRDSLDRNRLTETIERLRWRITERFPEAGLLSVCSELLSVSNSIDEDLHYIARPNWWLRGFVIFFIVTVMSMLGYGAMTMEFIDEQATMVEIIQIIEAAINDIVLVGAALIFLVSAETRAKRRRVVEAINRLRSIAHVIDMHQLTKDPSIMTLGEAPTEHSPERKMSPGDLGRYLDYCSEMLALTSKVAFCYVQEFDDSEAVRAVNQLETLTTALATKVWQKIMLLNESRPKAN